MNSISKEEVSQSAGIAQLVPHNGKSVVACNMVHNVLRIFLGAISHEISLEAGYWDSVFPVALATDTQDLQELITGTRLLLGYVHFADVSEIASKEPAGGFETVRERGTASSPTTIFRSVRRNVATLPPS